MFFLLKKTQNILIIVVISRFQHFNPFLAIKDRLHFLQNLLVLPLQSQINDYLKYIHHNNSSGDPWSSSMGDTCVKHQINIHETLSCLLVFRARQSSMLRQTMSLRGNTEFICRLTIKLWGFVGSRLKYPQVPHQTPLNTYSLSVFLIRHFDLPLLHWPP